MEYQYDERSTICPSPNFTIKTTDSRNSTFSIKSFKNRLSNIFSTTCSEDNNNNRISKISRMSLLKSRSNPRRLRKQITRSKAVATSTAVPISPTSTKSQRSLLDRLASRKHLMLSSRNRRRGTIYSTYHNKPSTLDFRCAGDESSSIMMLERVGSINMNRMILGAVQKRKRWDVGHLLNDAPPRISWTEPDIGSWDFSEIGINISP